MPQGTNDRLWSLMPSIQKPLQVSAAYSMTLADTLIHLTIATNFNLTLPDVAEAQGLTFTIYCVARSANACTLVEKASGNSLGWVNKTIDAAGEKQVLRSDGKTWTFVESIPA